MQFSYINELLINGFLKNEFKIFKCKNEKNHAINKYYV